MTTAIIAIIAGTIACACVIHEAGFATTLRRIGRGLPRPTTRTPSLAGASQCEDECHWIGVKDGDERARAIYARHYTARHYRDGRPRHLFVGPGEKLVLLTKRCDALFTWRKFRDASGQQGVNCAVFRNEGPMQSSTLIQGAVTLAWRRWPGARLYTYVNPKAIRSTNPGFCFLQAGWQRCGQTKGGLLILELLPRAAAPCARCGGEGGPRRPGRPEHGGERLPESEEEKRCTSM